MMVDELGVRGPGAIPGGSSVMVEDASLICRNRTMIHRCARRSEDYSCAVWGPRRCERFTAPQSFCRGKRAGRAAGCLSARRTIARMKRIDVFQKELAEKRAWPLTGIFSTSTATSDERAGDEGGDAVEFRNKAVSRIRNMIDANSSHGDRE